MNILQKQSTIFIIALNYSDVLDGICPVCQLAGLAEKTSVCGNILGKNQEPSFRLLLLAAQLTGNKVTLFNHKKEVRQTGKDWRVSLSFQTNTYCLKQ